MEGKTIEIKINKEIRQYQESLFLGLSLRQFICSLLAVIAAVGIYFACKGTLGTEPASWLCILAAVPLAAMGFFSYNGMRMEQFVWAFIKSELVCAGRRLFQSENYYRLATMKKGGNNID